MMRLNNLVVAVVISLINQTPATSADNGAE